MAHHNRTQPKDWLRYAEDNETHPGDLDNKDIIDEVLISIFKDEKSYTGEESVEISCNPPCPQKLFVTLGVAWSDSCAHERVQEHAHVRSRPQSQVHMHLLMRVHAFFFMRGRTSFVYLTLAYMLSFCF